MSEKEKIEVLNKFTLEDLAVVLKFCVEIEEAICRELRRRAAP